MVDSLVNIRESCSSDPFADQLVAEPGLVAVQPVLDQVSSTVAGCIVNDYYFDFICRVVEVVDSLQVVMISVPHCIFKSGCYDTERQFF